MKNRVETNPINLPFETDSDDFCAIRSIVISPVQTLYFTNYADTKYIMFNTEVEKLSDEISQTLLDLFDKNATNKNTVRSAVMKLVKKYAQFTINRTS